MERIEKNPTDKTPINWKNPLSIGEIEKIAITITMIKEETKQKR